MDIDFSLFDAVDLDGGSHASRAAALRVAAQNQYRQKKGSSPGTDLAAPDRVCAQRQRPHLGGPTWALL
jgi:hypothetical protein